MHHPDRATFEELARGHAIVPVWREVLADTQTPVSAFLRLDPRPNAFLLESVEGGERWGRYSFLGGDTLALVTSIGGRIFVSGEAPYPPSGSETPLGYVKELLARCSAPRMPGLPRFHGGAVGYLGYDCVRELERLPDEPADDLGLPDLALMLTRTFAVFDNLTQKIFVISNAFTGSDPRRAYEEAADRCDETVARLGAALEARPLPADIDAAVEATPSVTDDEYARWVETAREHIFAGDIFQVVPSRRFETRLHAPAFDAYRVLRTINPSPYMYFLRFEETDEYPSFEIAGSSPEPMVRVTDGVIIARPIAGTRGRGADEEEDLALERELLSDEKERAEHVMLVDLARNDVGRIAAYGSVKVDELMNVERYSHVMHIVSNVTGRLAEGRSPFDAVTSCFPAGTVSGAPKVRAMEIIDSLERTKRGPYAGAVGYLDFSGDLDTCITIRTLVATGGTAYVQAGAGIVADSVGEAEAMETRRKAEALLSAVATANQLSADRPS